MSNGITITYLPDRSGFCDDWRRRTNWRPRAETDRSLPGARAASPDARAAVRVEWILDDGGRDPGASDQRIPVGPEAAHHPRVPATPHEQADRFARLAHRPSRREECLADRVRPDDLVRSRTEERETGGPAADARALPLAPLTVRSAQAARKSLETELRRGGPVVPGTHHVEHHLHARPDALDEVRLGDVIAPAPEIEVERGPGSRCRSDGQREHARQQQGAEPLRTHRSHRSKVRRFCNIGSRLQVDRARAYIDRDGDHR